MKVISLDFLYGYLPASPDPDLILFVLVFGLFPSNHTNLRIHLALSLIEVQDSLPNLIVLIADVLHGGLPRRNMRGNKIFMVFLHLNGHGATAHGASKCLLPKKQGIFLLDMNPCFVLLLLDIVRYYFLV